MFGRLGWLEILVIVVLVLILFGSNKIPGMMKNLADGLNVFKKEIKKETPKKAEAKKPATKKVTKKAPARKK
ncbi:MAG: twin-arginine translocase TatA/TatE family subunit [Alphaproteobacteria bacterium]|nr:twin-arginine translocase TatA/TatE family subunit [Alphaproteobacteria bacterium]